VQRSLIVKMQYSIKENDNTKNEQSHWKYASVRSEKILNENSFERID
jgi:hypothetical protein